MGPIKETPPYENSSYIESFDVRKPIFFIISWKRAAAWTLISNIMLLARKDVLKRNFNTHNFRCKLTSFKNLPFCSIFDSISIQIMFLSKNSVMVKVAPANQFNPGLPYRTVDTYELINFYLNKVNWWQIFTDSGRLL